MFERFTNNARRAVVLSQEVARERRQSYIAPRALLCGVLKGEGSTLSEIFDAIGTTRHDILAEIAEQMPPELDEVATGHLPFSEATKVIMRDLPVVAEELGVSYISEDHILVALLRGMGTDLPSLLQGDATYSTALATIRDSQMGGQGREARVSPVERAAERDGNSSQGADLRTTAPGYAPDLGLGPDCLDMQADV